MKRPTKRALVVQSESSNTLESAKRALMDDGYRIIRTENSAAVLKDLAALPIDIVLIEDSGERHLICEQIRQVSTVPIIVICEKDDELRRVLLLELGADYSLPRPVSNIELVARANSLLRHYQKQVP